MSESKAGHDWAPTSAGEESCRRQGCDVRRKHPPGSVSVWHYFRPGQTPKRHRIKCNHAPQRHQR